MEKPGQYLKRVRKNLGLSLLDVKEKTGISDSRLSRVETGECQEPPALMLKDLSRLYKIDLLDLLLRFNYVDEQHVRVLKGVEFLNAEQLSAVQHHINSYLPNQETEENQL